MTSKDINKVQNVSIHAPTRGATFVRSGQRDKTKGFQSTHPHGVRLVSTLGQPSRPCVSIHAPTRGATCQLFKYGKEVNVSIHAPTRGATMTSKDINKIQNVSIHAPTRGATAMWFKFVFSRNTFQSTHPHGVRHGAFYNTFVSAIVSIHAPTRGATVYIIDNQQFKLFQSTHPHGVRRLAQTSVVQSESFNPRTHTGCDVVGSQ